MHNSKDKRVAKTRDKLSSSLLEELKTRPLYAIKVSDLCHDANISRATFYNNFDSREEIVLLILDGLLSPLRIKCEEVSKEVVSPWQKRKEFVSFSVDSLSSYYSIFSKIVKDSSVPLFDRLYSFFDASLSSLLHGQEKEIALLPFGLFVCKYASILTGSIYHFCRQGSPLSSDTQKQMIYSLFFEKAWKGVDHVG